MFYYLTKRIPYFRRVWRFANAYYVKTIERIDADGLINLLLADLGASGTRDLMKSQMNIDISEKDIMDFYTAFYQNELEGLHDSLTADYGTFKIEYDIGDLEYVSQEEINEANDLLVRYGVNNLKLQNALKMDVQFYVINKEGHFAVTDSFLTPQVIFLKANDGWKMGTSSGFPSPDRDALMTFYGIKNDIGYYANGIIAYEKVYDAMRNQTKNTEYDEFGKMTSCTEYEYDTEGNLIKSTTYHTDGDRTEYEYNAEGNLTKSSVYNKDGIITSWEENEYDTMNRLIKWTYNNTEINLFFELNINMTARGTC